MIRDEPFIPPCPTWCRGCDQFRFMIDTGGSRRHQPPETVNSIRLADERPPGETQAVKAQTGRPPQRSFQKISSFLKDNRPQLRLPCRMAARPREIIVVGVQNPSRNSQILLPDQNEIATMAATIRRLASLSIPVEMPPHVCSALLEARTTVDVCNWFR
jgi:hypothetical protein